MMPSWRPYASWGQTGGRTWQSGSSCQQVGAAPKITLHSLFQYAPQDQSWYVLLIHSWGQTGGRTWQSGSSCQQVGTAPEVTLHSVVQYAYAPNDPSWCVLRMRSRTALSCLQTAHASVLLVKLCNPSATPRTTLMQP